VANPWPGKQVLLVNRDQPLPTLAFLI